MYIGGVGTRGGKWGRWFGGAFGFGGRKRVEEALRFACVPDLVRGVLIGRSSPLHVIGWSRGAALAVDFCNRFDGKVRSLTLLDCVASFGLPGRINLGYRLHYPDNVKHFFHLMALDEPLRTFKLTRFYNSGERWMSGRHGDVGRSVASYWQSYEHLISAGAPVRFSTFELRPEVSMTRLSNNEVPKSRRPLLTDRFLDGARSSRRWY